MKYATIRSMTWGIKVRESNQLTMHGNWFPKDPVTLKPDVVKCFTSILGAEHTTEAYLKTESSAICYDFGYGQLRLTPKWQRSTKYEALYDFYVYAEHDIDPFLREKLTEATSSHDDYMVSCVLMYLITHCGIFALSDDNTFLGSVPKNIINIHMWWVERMFIERIPAERILLALTRDIFIRTEKEYIVFRDNIRDLPLEWLNETYAVTSHASF